MIRVEKLFKLLKSNSDEYSTIKEVIKSGSKGGTVSTMDVFYIDALIISLLDNLVNNCMALDLFGNDYGQGQTVDFQKRKCHTVVTPHIDTFIQEIFLDI